MSIDVDVTMRLRLSLRSRAPQERRHHASWLVRPVSLGEGIDSAHDGRAQSQLLPLTNECLLQPNGARAGAQYGRDAALHGSIEIGCRHRTLHQSPALG